MTRILVMSDTHGNQQLLRVPFAHTKEYDYLFHLGDNYDDLDENPDLTTCAILERVPGLYWPGYLDGSVEHVSRVSVEGWSFLLAHDPEEAKLQDLAGVDFVLYGHTHRPGFLKHRGALWCNPGHLKRRFDRGHAASWMTIELTEGEAVLRLHNLSGAVILQTIETR